MRPAAASLLAAALFIACSSQAAVQPSGSPTSPAQSPAADLRTHLDLLLAEHVMIVAKESAAAVNHSDEYAPYTTLLGANSADLSALVGRAYGSTTSAQFQRSWDAQDGHLVDYAIGVASHDDDKASAAMAALQQGQSLDGIALGGESADERAFIDDLMAQRYASFYADLRTAYAHTQPAGDALTARILQRFPDRFPGQIDGAEVDHRVAMNLQLQQHSYLATMATDATLAQRDGEKAAATAALAASSKQLDATWADWDAALLGYAGGSAFPKMRFEPTPAAQHLVDATLKVVDDQKTKNPKPLANDDRAAATAMQPIADSTRSSVEG